VPAFTFAVSLAASLLLASRDARRVEVNLNDALKQGARSGASGGPLRLRARWWCRDGAFGDAAAGAGR